MNENLELKKLSELCWQFRRDEGYLKPLPSEYKKAALEIIASGAKPLHVVKYLGVPAHSIKDWKRSLESHHSKINLESDKKYFTEIKTKASLSTKDIVDKSNSAISINFEKNGIKYEIKNLSAVELIQIVGLSR